jgi:integrase/recombinase XerD
MDISTPPVSPLRQRMLEDMRMRKFEPKTQSSYLRAVRNFAVFLKASPDVATAEDLRRFQMHMVEQGTSPITLNATISGLKFFFGVTLDRGESMAKMRPIGIAARVVILGLGTSRWSRSCMSALARREN